MDGRSGSSLARRCVCLRAVFFFPSFFLFSLSARVFWSRPPRLSSEWRGNSRLAAVGGRKKKRLFIICCLVELRLYVSQRAMMSCDTMRECDPLTPIHYPPPLPSAIAMSTLA